MALAFNNNLAAQSSHYQLMNVQANLDKSIQRISSGLRLLSAADDPSGVAVSQRLHKQILGLNRAFANVQDSVSYLQTAESALSSTQSILQRMRELGVQAANGTLTSSDRQEIQKEIDQLTSEVDRIAKTTEYNTRKLLDGSASALWSTSTDKINVVVRGKVAEGNYELEIDNEPVENHVLKTDIFNVKSTAQAVDNVDLGATNASFVLNGTSTSSGTLSFDFGNGTTYSLAVTANITQAQLAAAITQDDYLNDYIRTFVDYTAVASGALTFQAIKAGAEGNSYSVQADIDNVGFVSGGLAHLFTGGDDYPSGVTGIANPTAIPAATAIASTYNVWVDNVIAVGATDTATIVASYEQPIGETITAATTAGALATAISTVIASATITAPEGSGYAIVEVIQGGVAGVDEIKARVSFDKGQTWYMTNDLGDAASAGLTHVVTDGTSQFELSEIAAGAVVNKGDKVLVALNDRNFNAASHAEMRVDTPFVNGLGGAEQVGPRWAFATDALNNKTKTVTVGYLDTKTGDIKFGSIDVIIDTLDSDSAVNPELTALETDNLITFNVTGAGGPAFSTTKLWQIDRFYDASGNFILGEQGKYLNIYNTAGNMAKVYLDPENTIGEIADKIENAIKNPISEEGLGMATGNASIDGHLADFIVQPTNLTHESVAGTIIIRSPEMGPKGKLYFASDDEDLMNAFSLVTIQDPVRDPMTITVRNAHTGDFIGEGTVSDNVLKNVIRGVDIEVDSQIDIDLNWDTASRKIVFTNANGKVKEFVHIVDNSKQFQVGPNQGETVDNQIMEMTAHALRVDGLLVVSEDLADSSITKISDAIDMVSSERARLGAFINRFEQTANTLSVQSANAYASESRIKDLDVAKEATEFSKLQILSEAAMSMLAQANKLPQNLLQLLR